MKTGEVAFERANGRKFYEFFMTENPEYRNLFNNSMTFLTNQAVDSLFEVYDFGQFGTVMDVGGNQGALIAHIVKKFGCKASSKNSRFSDRTWGNRKRPIYTSTSAGGCCHYPF